MAKHNSDQFLNRDSVELISDIQAALGDAEATSLSEGILEQAARLSVDLGQRMAAIAQLKVMRVGKNGLRRSEDARRRLENPKLMTSYPFDRARALLAERLYLVETINSHLQKAIGPQIRLQMVDAELHAVAEVLAEIRDARAVHRETGLYAGSANFISRLKLRFDIGWHDLDALTDEDEAQIAQVVSRRVKSTPTGGGAA